MEALASPLSSREQPRDLRFRRPVLEMFFDRVRMQVEVKVCRAYGARTMLGILCQPCRAGLTFGGRPHKLRAGSTGLKSPSRLLEKLFQDEPVELQIPRLRSG